MSLENLFSNNFGMTSADDLFPQSTSFPAFPNGANIGSTQSYIDQYVSQFVVMKDFESINSDYITANYFKDVKPKILNNITIVQEPDCKTDLIPKEFYLFRNNDGIKGYDQDRDDLIAKIIVYVSTNGVKLKHLYDCIPDQIKENEIIFFLEDNTEDSSGPILYVRFGAESLRGKLLGADAAALDQISELVPEFSNDMLRELISNGFVRGESTILESVVKGIMWAGVVIFAIPKAVGWLSSQIGDAIADNLKIPEKVWNSQSPDYVFDKKNLIKDLQIDISFLNGLNVILRNNAAITPLVIIPIGGKIINQNFAIVTNLVHQYNLFVEDTVKSWGRNTQIHISEEIAFICGVWNGLVDFIADIFLFIGLLLEAPFDIAYNFKDFLESIDSFLENVRNFSFIEFFLTTQRLQLQITSKIIDFLNSDNPRAEYNFDKLAYFAGYGIAFIASLFIPFADISRLATITKVDKLVPDEFLKSLYQSGKNNLKGSKAFIKFIDDVGALLGKKGDELYNELKKIIDNFVEWFKGNREIFKGSKVLRGINVTNNYLRKYIGRDLQPLVIESRALSLYGKAGRNVVKAVDNEVAKLVKNTKSNNIRRKYVMISGMVYKKGRKISNVHTRPNFLPEEIGKINEEIGKYVDDLGKDSVYQKFLDNMHPTLKNRYEIHLEEIAKGLNALPLDIRRAAKPGSHGEIRALDNLLKEIDPKAVIGDDIFKDILGYNRYLMKDLLQPPCTHCFYLTDFVTYIGL